MSNLLSRTVNGFKSLFSAPEVSAENRVDVMQLAKVAGALKTQKRLSQDEALSLFNVDLDKFAGFDHDSRRRLITVIRGMANTDEDLGPSMRDFVTMVNQGYEITIEGSGVRAKANAKAIVKDYEQRITEYAGGLDGLIDNQVAEAYLTGGMSTEFFPDPARSMVQDAAIVPYDEIKVQRDKESQLCTFHQVQNVDKEILLDPLTYSFKSYRPAGRSFYGTPVPLSTLKALDRKIRMIKGFDRIINFISNGNMISVTAPQPPPSYFGLKSASDPKYIEGVRSYFSELKDLILNGAENGLILTPEQTFGKVEVTIVPVQTELAGTYEIEVQNQLRIWSSLLSAPFLRGKLDATTQALAKVIWLMIESHAVNVQNLVKQHVLKGINLDLRLHGVAAAADIEFAPPKSPFKKEEQDGMRAEAQADKILYDMLGLDYLPKLAKKHSVNLGVDRKDLPDEILKEDKNERDDKTKV